MQFIKETPQLHYFKALTPVKFRYLQYDVHKSIDETLHYKVVVEASYKQTSFKGIDKPGHYMHEYYAYTFKRSPLIASDGSVQYTDIKRYARINVARKMQFAIKEKPLSKNEASKNSLHESNCPTSPMEYCSMGCFYIMTICVDIYKAIFVV